MSVRVAASAGFCFGVDRAVGLVEQTVREGKRAVTLGPVKIKPLGCMALSSSSGVV